MRTGPMREEKRSMRSTEQVVIISGAASGIGLELCRLFARRGASVGLMDRDGSSWRSSRTSCFGLERDVPSLSLMSATVSRWESCGNCRRAWTGRYFDPVCWGLSRLDSRRSQDRRARGDRRHQFLWHDLCRGGRSPYDAAEEKRPHRRHLEHGRLARDTVRTGLFGEQGGGGGLFGKPSIGAQAKGDRRHDGVPGLCANAVAR